MKKSEAIEKINPTATYLGSYVIKKIQDITIDDKLIPQSLKKGDVISLDVGHKRRPSVVIRVREDVVISIPLTSQADCKQALFEGTSRFFSGGWFTNSYEVTEYEFARSRFLGVFDNRADLNNAIKELDKYIKSLRL